MNPQDWKSHMSRQKERDKSQNGGIKRNAKNVVDLESRRRGTASVNWVAVIGGIAVAVAGYFFIKRF